LKEEATRKILGEEAHLLKKKTESAAVVDISWGGVLRKSSVIKNKLLKKWQAKRKGLEQGPLR